MRLQNRQSQWGKRVKITKLIYLGSVAGLVFAGGSLAADLPSRKAAPVQYVKICDAYGAGFFYIPGTDTCLRIGGYVRAEYQYTPGVAVRSVATGLVTQVAGDQDTWGQEVRGRVDLDARTQSAWGTVQTVVRLRGSNVDGIRNSAATALFGTGYAPVANGSTSMTMERAYIRFAGFTFGVGSENFVTFPSIMYHGNISAGFPNGIKQLAYTATFGGGFSATIALESRSDFNGQSGVANWTYVTRPDTGLMLVGNVRADQSWGFVQLSGALGANSAQALTNTNANNLLSGASTQTSYAIGFGAKVNLNQIAQGDAFYLTAAYAKGVFGLTGCNQITTCSDSSNKRMNGGVLGTMSNVVVTNTVLGVNTLAQSTSWNVAGLFTHYWTPSWRSNVEVGYMRYSVPSATAVVATSLGSSTIWGAMGNLIWSPVRNFDIGVELAYYQNKLSIRNPALAFTAAGSPGLSNNNWSGKLRLERTF